MDIEHQNQSSLHSNDSFSYSEEIIEQFMMELPVFNDENPNKAVKRQQKKKVLKPIRTHTLSASRRQCKSNTTPYQTTYTSNNKVHSNTLSNVNNLLSHDLIIQIQKLENKLIEVQMKIQELITENRLLKTTEKRQANALSMYEGKQAKLPKIIKIYEEDVRTLQNRIRQIKSSYKEIESRYKAQNTKHIVLQNQYKHLVNLSKNKQLEERQKLSDNLEEAQNTIKQQSEQIRYLMKQVELQNKTHKHHMNAKNTKIKELQTEIKQLTDEKSNSHLDKLKTRAHSARQVFTNGITEDSISLLPRVMKPMSTINRQGEESDKSYNKTDKSITFKLESLQDKKNKYEVDCLNENVQINSINQIENTATKHPNIETDNESYLSNMPSNIPWLNQNVSKLTEGGKVELSNLIKNNFENKNHSTSTSVLLGKSMSRTQKDQLLANLDKLKEDKKSYEKYYKSNILKHASSEEQENNRKLSLSINIDDTSSDSEAFTISD